MSIQENTTREDDHECIKAISINANVVAAEIKH